jgi:hypothetical protein
MEERCSLLRRGVTARREVTINEVLPHRRPICPALPNVSLIAGLCEWKGVAEMAPSGALPPVAAEPAKVRLLN